MIFMDWLRVNCFKDDITSALIIINSRAFDAAFDALLLIVETLISEMIKNFKNK